MSSLDPSTMVWLIGLGGILAGLSLGYLLTSIVTRAQRNQFQQNSRKETEKSIQAERQRLRAVYNLISALNATLNYQRVLDTALDLSSDALGKIKPSQERMVSAVLLFSENDGGQPHLSVGSARRFTPADMRITVTGTSGLVGEAIEEGVSTFTKEIAEDPELSRFVGLRGCKSVYCVPISSGLDRYGVLVFAHPEPDYFTPSQREVLDLIGTQTMIAIQNARLYQDLEQEKERMMDIQEEARKKLARDLHDGPTQSIAAIAMRVNFARRLMERDAKAGAEELYKIEDLARRTTKEIRHMLFTLRPLVLESQGLVAALEAMAEKMKDTYGQNVTIVADPNVVSELEMGKQGVIFYIAEEAVNNARKHAQAARIWVRIKAIEKEVALLEIEDNGVGFNVGAVDASYELRGSLGMVNMRERTELVNGILQIDSAEGKGTRIRVFIPLSEEASDKLRRGEVARSI
jgi:signal transduction histidine kinase